MRRPRASTQLKPKIRDALVRWEGCVFMRVLWHTGVLLISMALCADAAIGNVQEKAMKLHNGSNSEMVPGFQSISQSAA